MNAQRELDLLVDLTRLLERYGPETFEKLASGRPATAAADEHYGRSTGQDGRCSW